MPDAQENALTRLAQSRWPEAIVRYSDGGWWIQTALETRFFSWSYYAAPRDLKRLLARPQKQEEA